MQIMGFEIKRAQKTKALANVDSDRGWHRIFDWKPGAWQQHEPLQDSQENLLAHSAVFACVTLIASDVAKLKLQVQEQRPGFWRPVADDLRGILRWPNHFQTRIQLFESWVLSKLLHGNAYVLKGREPRSGFVNRLYVLDPCKVDVLVDERGEVFYRLRTDHLAGITQPDITIPASEIIHDRANCFSHPLIGNSPLRAAAWSATAGNKITKNSASFFKNMSRPSGMLVAPGAISNESADRLKAAWQENFGGDNVGKLAVVGDGLKYESMVINAADSQLVEQLGFTAVDVARAFRVPPFLIGAGASPNGMNSTTAAHELYYSVCLQSHIESIEAALDAGLELPDDLRTQFDLDGLLRMDSATRFAAYSAAITGGWLSPNEARARENLPPVAGGETPYLQMQNFSLLALSKRDATENPFATAAPSASPK